MKAYKCLIAVVEHDDMELPSGLVLKRGWGNGYVGVPSNHPLFGKPTDYRIKVENEDIPFNGNIIGLLVESFNPERENLPLDLVIPVHGGLTFSSDELPNRAIIVSKNKPIEGEKYWWFGFDTAHCDDNKTNCNFDFVLDQSNKLCHFLTKYKEIQ